MIEIEIKCPICGGTDISKNRKGRTTDTQRYNLKSRRFFYLHKWFDIEGDKNVFVQFRNRKYNAISLDVLNP